MTLLVDAILALTVVEAGVFLLLGRARLVANVLAGAMLLAGLRLALAGAPAVWLLAPLALAGLAHAADLRARWS